jgi:hypothetical protein
MDDDDDDGLDDVNEEDAIEGDVCWYCGRPVEECTCGG